MRSRPHAGWTVLFVAIVALAVRLPPPVAATRDPQPELSA